MTIGKDCNAADRPILRMPGTRWVTQRVRCSTSPGRTARFEKRGPAGEYFAFQKLKNKRRERHRQCQQGHSRQHIAVAQLVEDAAIRIVKMNGEKIGKPTVAS